MPVNKTDTIRVLIVDDHPFMRRGLAQVVQDQPQAEVCGEAASLPEALQQMERHKPDVVIIDISLGDEGNGIELIKEIKRRWPETSMLVCSMHDESLFAERALRAGALGYVNKSEDTQTFVKALRRIFAGQVSLSPRMTDRLLTQFTGSNRDSDQPRIAALSDRELEVFELLGRGLITKQIAAKLKLSRKTIETYREHIKAKLGLNNGTELTREATRWVLEQGQSG